MTKAAAAALFNSMDKDHSGSISLDKFNSNEFDVLDNITSGLKAFWANTSSFFGPLSIGGEGGSAWHWAVEETAETLWVSASSEDETKTAGDV
jgi:hypothetical protein